MGHTFVRSCLTCDCVLPRSLYLSLLNRCKMMLKNTVGAAAADRRAVCQQIRRGAAACRPAIAALQQRAAVNARRPVRVVASATKGAYVTGPATPALV